MPFYVWDGTSWRSPQLLNAGLVGAYITDDWPDGTRPQRRSSLMAATICESAVDAGGA
jgi:hypothetical protein